jgi:nitroreductase
MKRKRNNNMKYDLASVDYILQTTRSVRKRLDLSRQVDPETVMEAMEIALQAPSGSNRQGWKWLIVTDAEKKRKIGKYYKKAFGLYAASQIFKGIDKEKRKVASSATYLANHMGDVPMMVFACVIGKPTNSASLTSLHGSIMPAAWSLMLALRARGIGSAWTTLHLMYEKQCNHILEIPKGISTAVLLPVGYFTGETFQIAKRTPANEVTYWNTWGNKKSS